jgi:hypothetical protein
MCAMGDMGVLWDLLYDSTERTQYTQKNAGQKRS